MNGVSGAISLIGTEPRLGNLRLDVHARASVRAEQEAYNRLMGRSVRVESATTAKQRAREAAEQLVAITFVRPILEQLRESNHAAPPFGPTSGEKQFRAFLDAKLADEITRAAQFSLVDRIASDLAREPVQPEWTAHTPSGATR
ncbi:MAG: hypothetical protein IH985_04145 [Planctomycetes bacterium]|nr:hypothetical protein [Planctomycetota bacterium]